MLRSASQRGMLSPLKRYPTPRRSLGPGEHLGAAALDGTTSTFPQGGSFPPLTPSAHSDLLRAQMDGAVAASG